MDQQKKTFKDFHKRKHWKKIGGRSEEGIDRMERLIKELRLDQGVDPGNRRVEMARATRDKFWNFERAYYVWTTKCVGGQNSSRKPKGQRQVKERKNSAIASLDSCRENWLNKKQRKAAEKGCV
jgi:hypothetical protein